MAESTEQKAVRLGASAGRAVAREAMEGRRRGFTITKFGRHEDGYFHAWVNIDGDRFYVHRRHGSWLAPGKVGERAVLKELEALMPDGLDVKVALQLKARAVEKAERAEEEADAPQDGDAGPDDPAGRDESVD